MAYDEGLAQRVRELLAGESGISEKRMFGGLAFLLKGNMSVGIVQDNLMVRVGPEAYDSLVGRSHARPMDFTGRPMRGFVYVAPEGIESDVELRCWIEHGVNHARSLPPK